MRVEVGGKRGGCPLGSGLSGAFAAAQLEPQSRLVDQQYATNLKLVQMLVDFAPEDVRRELDNGLLNGPQINPEGKSDVVADQGQVDDLLDSLGF